jgi:hypothetical protein
MILVKPLETQNVHQRFRLVAFISQTRFSHMEFNEYAEA